MMEPNTLALAMSLCTFGMMGWVALMIAFGLVALLRKAIGWMV